MTWRLWNRKNRRSSEQADDKGEWSLRASGATYDDRSGESETITDRIMRSSASVTGIAGERGTGKSSLALRVLANCRNSAFTQVIHAPTEYDHREFFVSVVQRMCEEVIAAINHKFGQPESLRKRGRAELRRLLRIGGVLFVGLVVSCGGSVWYAQRQYDVAVARAIEAQREAEKERLDRERERLSAQISELVQSGRVPQQDALQELVDDLASQLGDIEVRLQEVGTRANFYVAVVPTTTAIILVGYAVATVLLRFLLRVGRRMFYVFRFPREAGLRQRAIDLAEYLRFETTKSVSAETGLKIAKLAAGKAVADRPLSLPGIAAQFGVFLREVAEVFDKRVVVCLDELDKIEDVEDLGGLLRGIKSVLGVPGTHFVLTVAEDALSRFAARGRGERGVIESTFEEIILLGGMSLEVADSMVDRMYPERDRWNQVKAPRSAKRVTHPSTVLLWVFGGGIPREIKRGALRCLEAGVRPKVAASNAVWNVLVKWRLEAMRTWAARVGGDDRITYCFCTELVESLSLLEGECKGMVSDVKRGRDIAAVWRAWFERLLPTICDRADSGDETTNAWVDGEELSGGTLLFGRAAIELAIGASALGYVITGRRNGFGDGSIERLREVFEVGRSNLPYAWRLVREHLDSVGVEIDVLCLHGIEGAAGGRIELPSRGQ